ncbi:anti-sigma factor domain-containing protein [Paraglaciecola sp. 2405UD69-4]|uniref:anti-sigma factor n=1 Tax=Paraglaciecola sp. 2405UD69-4 TaxID=3391836 RepID=UPI0039C9E606
MNYLAEETRHALAAEYVIGTMHGKARKRYQALIMQYPEIRETTYVWEQHFNALGEHLEPIAPDPIVWEKIVQRLDNEAANSEASNVVKLEPRLTLLKSLPLVATAAAIILALVMLPPKQELPLTVEQFTVVQDKDYKSLWLIEVYEKTLDVVATKNLVPKPSNDYQLWMVPSQGGVPISLGLLPQRGELTLTKIPEFDELDIAAIAVSLEPLGGSPNGSPTEVLYVSELAIL